jgi:hypothetical protein
MLPTKSQPTGLSSSSGIDQDPLREAMPISSPCSSNIPSLEKGVDPSSIHAAEASPSASVDMGLRVSFLDKSVVKALSLSRLPDISI